MAIVLTTFYDMEGATALAEALDDFEEGHLVINVIAKVAGIPEPTGCI